MLLACVRGSSRVQGGVAWLVCRGPVYRGRRVVLDRVVVVLEGVLVVCGTPALVGVVAGAGGGGIRDGVVR